MAQALVAAMFAASLVVAGPSAPKAHAIPDWANPCNLPGGKTVCDGAKWVYDKSGARTVVNGVGEAIDFASNPLGYIEQKMRGGTKGMFSAFGEELTGKKAEDPKKGRKKSKGD